MLAFARRACHQASVELLGPGRKLFNAAAVQLEKQFFPLVSLLLEFLNGRLQCARAAFLRARAAASHLDRLILSHRPFGDVRFYLRASQIGVEEKIVKLLAGGEVELAELIENRRPGDNNRDGGDRAKKNCRRDRHRVKRAHPSICDCDRGGGRMDANAREQLAAAFARARAHLHV